jgi:hypothetical protein
MRICFSSLGEVGRIIVMLIRSDKGISAGAPSSDKRVFDRLKASHSVQPGW